MKKVLCYGLSTCPGCRKVTKFFLDNNVEFEYVEYDLADEATQAVIRRDMDASGTPSFPWVKIDGTVVVGYNPARLSELLGIKPEKKPWER